MLVLCILILVTAFFPVLYKLVKKPVVYDFKEFKAEIAAFKASAKPKNEYSYKQIRDEMEEKELAAEYFEFDPNGLPANQWKRLGLSGRQIAVIKNYEAKGGKFYRKEDVQKIYSVTAADYVRLEPYIRIKARYQVKDYKPFEKNERRENYARSNNKAAIVLVELNQADSALLETVRGIGPAFASRIIRYKTRLGGFYKKEQLLEVYGMDSVKYAGLKDQVKVNENDILKININTATFDELKPHPYLTYKQMNAIIQYRKQHGAYTNAADLEKIAILDKNVIIKLEPYISF